MSYKQNKQNKYLFIYLFSFILFILCYLFIYYSFFLKKENFTNWSKNSVDKFLSFQSTVNPQSHFDMNIIQQQSTENEAKQLLSNGYWPWSKQTEYLYMDAVANEPIVRLTPGFSMQAAKQIYNENAIKQLLSMNTKEGQFLLNGGFTDDKKGLSRHEIKCFSNVKGPSILKKIQINGYNLWNGYKNEQITTVANEDIPNEMPGFSFVDGPCNPCSALDLDYSCPFQLNVGGDNKMILRIGADLQLSYPLYVSIHYYQTDIPRVMFGLKTIIF